jgi:hypothetical protein
VTWIRRIREWLNLYAYSVRLEREVDRLRTQNMVLSESLARKREAEWRPRHPENGLEAKLNAKLAKK